MCLNPAPGNRKKEEQGLKANFYYIISLRPGYMRPYLKIPGVCFWGYVLPCTLPVLYKAV